MDNNYYLHQTEKWMDEGKCPEKVVRKMNALLDQEVLQPLMVADKEKYWHLMRKMHEMCEGNHFNEEFAMYEVGQMHHTGTDGKIRKGAHWTLDAIQQVYNKQKSVLPSDTTVYDVYVALNSFYHDNCKLYKVWFPEDYEAKIIEGAINYFFKDEDCTDKVWKYFNCMR